MYDLERMFYVIRSAESRSDDHFAYTPLKMRLKFEKLENIAKIAVMKFFKKSPNHKKSDVYIWLDLPANMYFDTLKPNIEVCLDRTF